MPGPMVEDTVTERRYCPLAADGFARTIASIRASRFTPLPALGEPRAPPRLADAVREPDGAAHHLVGVLGIHPEPQGHVHRLVELGAGQLLEDAERLLDRVGLLTVVEGLGCLQLLGRGCHLGSCLSSCLSDLLATVYCFSARLLSTVYFFQLFNTGAPTWPPHSPRPRTTVCVLRSSCCLPVF